ncbi:ArnT family glycosyltransferase [Providencia burhodogranariea]|uniref:Undecaprenyl phosphate-alpha-4-amino-4-deoxy-L-arabinose arabinosyl transferase n=1 Tax=Providencia burhodogranariea DSM 19968 TaxID=1141662 RepID=K8W9Q4_9GAMM|nr:hypothetical protein [Providencia burhodogranariea]EKT52920.1 hypothetical protein OOA_19379 [Providencia burhodogranariea DSM 19968]
MKKIHSKLTPTENNLFILFIGFLIIYLLPGIYGHTPWKQDENYSFGIIQTMFESGNWLIPTNAGEPFMEKPPLYYWVATIMSHLFSDVMPLYDAARCATLFFSIINFLFFLLLARRAFNATSFEDKRIWIALALYACSPGILRHSHDMFTDVALMAGATIGLYGILGLIQQQQIRMSALWLALGTVITMLSKGAFVPGVLWISLLLTPIFHPQCRQKTFWFPIIMAGSAALILILPWPILLYHQQPELFMAWLWENNIGRFSGFSVEKLGAKANLTRIPAAVIFFALPSGILAVIYFLKKPLQTLHSTNEYLLVMFPLLAIIILQISATGRALYLLPFIAPFAILGTQTLLSIPEKSLRLFSSFATVFWSILIIFLWVCYFIALSGYTETWLFPFSRWLPMNYQMPFSVIAITCAAALTIIWFLRNRLLSTQIAVHAIQNWALGMCIVWGIMSTLFLSWIDYTKGFESVFVDLNKQLDGLYHANDCMASYDIGESEAPMLYYYTKILHQRQKYFAKPQQCRWLIVLSKQIEPAPQGMALFWTNHRPLQLNENLVVYKNIE